MSLYPNWGSRQQENNLLTESRARAGGQIGHRHEGLGHGMPPRRAGPQSGMGGPDGPTARGRVPIYFPTFAERSQATLFVVVLKENQQEKKVFPFFWAGRLQKDTLLEVSNINLAPLK